MAGPSAPHLAFDGRFSVERARRLRAATTGSWWSSNAPWKVKRLTFRSVVQMTLLLAFVLSKFDYDVLDQFTAAKCRVILKGAACEKTIGHNGKMIKYKIKNLVRRNLKG